MTCRRTRIALLVVFCAVLVQIALHGWTIDSLLPHGKEPDAALVRQSLLLRGEGPWNDHAWSKYPHLLPSLMALVPRASELTLESGVGPAQELRAHLEFCARHLVAARWIIVLMAALALPLTYRLGRRLLSPTWSAVAVLFLATSLLMQSFAHQARPHAALMAPVLAALLTTERWARRGTGRDLLLATLSCSIALATLHSGAFVLIGALLALIHRWKAKARPGWLSMAAVLGGLLVAARLAYPFLFDTPNAGDEFESGLGSYSFPHLVTLERFTGTGFGILGHSSWSYDPVLTIFAGLGLISFSHTWLVGREEEWSGSNVKRPVLSVLFVPPLVYLIIFGLYSRTFERFLLPLLPFLAVLAAHGLATLQRVLARHTKLAISRRLTAVVTLLALGMGLWPCARLAWLHCRSDSYERTAEWVLETPATVDQRVLISPNVNLPLLLPTLRNEAGGPPDSVLKLPWIKYLGGLPEGSLENPVAPVLPLAEGGRLPLSAKGFTQDSQVILQLIHTLRGDYIITEQESQIDEATRRLRENQGVPVTRFGPWGSESQRSSALRYTSTSFRGDVLEAHYLGPVLEVWKLK